jgi:hypothetical protein
VVRATEGRQMCGEHWDLLGPHLPAWSIGGLNYLGDSLRCGRGSEDWCSQGPDSMLVGVGGCVTAYKTNGVF